MDNSKIKFSTQWNIAQQVEHETSVSFSATDLFFSPGMVVSWASVGLGYIPRTIVTWKAHTDTRWQLDGASDGTRVCQSELRSDGLYFGTDGSPTVSVDVRYTIYKDPVII